MFLRGSNPIWFEVDLTAHAFDDTFYMFVLENDLPYAPAVVYHDPSGNVPWTNPIRFLANGTLPIDIFWDSNLVYRLEFRQGPTQADPLIYLVENYMPGNGSGPIPAESSLVTENQITNPQFSLINFDSPLALTSITNPAPLEIAPGWTLYLTGTGNVTLTQVPLNDSPATLNLSNSPYALEINLNGAWSTATLRQRFQQNGMLWANKYVSSSITASIQGTQQAISAILVDSNGTTIGTVLPSVVIDSVLTEYVGETLLPASTNPDLPPVAYIEYQLILPLSADIFLTSFQLVAGDLPLTYEYLQDTIDRQIDHTFHYYKPWLEYKPIPSYTIGWDFKYNPCQELGTAIAVSGLGNDLSRYIADQTIAFESVGNAFSYTFNNGGLGFSTATNSQVAFIQYLDSATAYELIHADNLCVQVKGGGFPKGYVSLYWTDNASLPDITSNLSLVTGLTLGIPTVVAGWNIIKNPLRGDNAPIFSGISIQSLNGWIAPAGGASVENVTWFAIVVSFTEIATMTAPNIQHITLNLGNIPTSPPPMNEAQTLQALQYYYEKSYDPVDLPGDATAAGTINEPMTVGNSGGNTGCFAKTFGFEYNTIKRVIPNATLYAEDGTVNAITAFAKKNAGAGSSAVAALGTYWMSPNISTKAFSASPSSDTVIVTTGGAPTVTSEAFIGFQYVLDARFGVV